MPPDPARTCRNWVMLAPSRPRPNARWEIQAPRLTRRRPLSARRSAAQDLASWSFPGYQLRTQAKSRPQFVRKLGDCARNKTPARGRRVFADTSGQGRETGAECLTKGICSAPSGSSFRCGCLVISTLQSEFLNVLVVTCGPARNWETAHPMPLLEVAEQPVTSNLTLAASNGNRSFSACDKGPKLRCYFSTSSNRFARNPALEIKVV